MPQEKPEVSKKTLWKLYAQVRRLQREGWDYQKINDKLLEDGRVDGIANLEQQLGIHEQTSSRKGRLQGAAANIAEGATFGHAGELGGMIAGMIPGGMDYEAGRERIESRIGAHRDEFPKSAIAGEMAGAAVPTMMLGGGSPAASGGILGRSVAGAGQGALLGGMGGAAYGHGLAEPGGRMRGTAVGGAFGAGAGGVLGGMTPAAGGVLRNLGVRTMENFGPLGQRAAARVRDQFPARKLAGAELAGAMEAAGMPADAAAVKIGGMPKGSVLADLDPVLADQARAARNTAPSLRRVGGPVQNVTDRHYQRGARMASELRGLTGLDEVAHPDAVLTAAKQAWRKNYLKPIQESNPEWTHRGLAQALDDFPEIGEFLGREGVQLRNLRTGEPISFGKAWDALQEMKGALGGKLPSNRYESMTQAIDALDGMMQEAIPNFGQSQRFYANVNARHRAYKAGEAMRNKSPRQIEYEYGELGGEMEQTAFREGLLDSVEDALRKDATGAGPAAQMVRGGENRDKLRVLFPDDNAFEAWIQSLQNEARWGITYNSLMGNSSTALQLADQSGSVSKYAVLNEILSVMFEDPLIRRQASEQVGQVLLSEGRVAATELAARIVAHEARRTAARGVGLLTGAAAARAGKGLLY
jgi:hypothetical protein